MSRSECQPPTVSTGSGASPVDVPSGELGPADDALRAATGKGWDDWRAVMTAWPGHDGGHAAVAGYLSAEHGVDGWWAQSITVGWERRTGRRAKHQRQDGTFEVSTSRTVTVDAEELRRLLRSDNDRAALFPGLATKLRSRPGSKDVRFTLGPGHALVSFTDRPDGRTRVTVTFAKLTHADQVDPWRVYWRGWLTALDEAAQAASG